MRHRLAWPWWALVGVVTAWLLWMTLRPNRTVAADLAPLTESATARGISAHVLIDLAGNVVVFAPLGAALALALGDRSAMRRGHRLLLATLVGAGLSLVIELLQTAIPTRVAALDDWMLNAVGTAIGALFGLYVQIYITQHGRPKAVLLGYEAYERLIAQLEDLADLASLREGADEPTRPFGEFLQEISEE